MFVWPILSLTPTGPVVSSDTTACNLGFSSVLAKPKQTQNVSPSNSCSRLVMSIPKLYLSCTGVQVPVLCYIAK